jgi:hypothetical protein
MIPAMQRRADPSPDALGPPTGRVTDLIYFDSVVLSRPKLVIRRNKLGRAWVQSR